MKSVKLSPGNFRVFVRASKACLKKELARTPARFETRCEGLSTCIALCDVMIRLLNDGFEIEVKK